MKERIGKWLLGELVAIRKDYTTGLITMLVLYIVIAVGEALLKLPVALKIQVNWIVAVLFISIPPLLVGIVIRSLQKIRRIRKFLKKLPTEVVKEKLYRFWDGNKFLLGFISEPYRVQVIKNIKRGERTIKRKRLVEVVLFSEITGGPTSPGGGIAGKEVPLKSLIETDYTKKDAVSISMTLGGKELKH